MPINTNRKALIVTKKDYDATMRKIETLMKKGEKNLTDQQAEEIRTLSLAAQAKGIGKASGNRRT